MANADRPNGFTPVGTISGSSWEGQVREYSTDGGEALFIGDAVALDADGYIRPANAAEDILGVAVGIVPTGSNLAGEFLTTGNLGATEHPGYAPAGVTTRVLVAVGKDVIYKVQDDASGSAAADAFADINLNMELTPTAGSTTTGRSAHELSRTGKITGTAQFRIIGYTTAPDNDPTADNAEYLVIINEHTLNEGAGS